MSCQVYVNKRDRKSVGHTKLWKEMIKKWLSDKFFISTGNKITIIKFALSPINVIKSLVGTVRINLDVTNWLMCIDCTVTNS